jgi:hypothetical protein
MQIENWERSSSLLEARTNCHSMTTLMFLATVSLLLLSHYLVRWFLVLDARLTIRCKS